MASRKLVRDLVLSKNRESLYRHLLSSSSSSQQVTNSSTRLRQGIIGASWKPGYHHFREFSVFNEFTKRIKEEVNSNPKFQQSVKELAEKAEEKAEKLKVVKEDVKVRAKQTTEQLYKHVDKHVDGAWTEVEARAKKVKETLGMGKPETSESSHTSADSGSKANESHKSSSEEHKQQQSGPQDTSETLFDKVKSGAASVLPKFSEFSQKFKDTKVVDLAKKGFHIVKDELSSNPSKRKRIEYEPSPAATRANVERSTVTDITVVPIKQSPLNKKWEAFKEKMRRHPMFKRVSGLSEPVVNKSQEIAEDMRERWHTSDHPVVNKIQDLNDSVFGENDSAMSFKEIRRRDPNFSLPEFASEVQEVVKPVLNAYFKADTEVLKKYCSSELIDRCKAEHNAYERLGVFYENKILHISDVEVRETKMMGDTPLIIVQFQTQQVHCVRDRVGAIVEGSQDTINTVHYLWAMAQMDVEELGEGALYPIWRLRDMQQVGIRALI